MYIISIVLIVSFAVYRGTGDVPSDGGWWGPELCVHPACTPENFHQCLSANRRHATVQERSPRPSQNQWVHSVMRPVLLTQGHKQSHWC